MKPAIAARTAIAVHEGTSYDNFVLGFKQLNGETQNTVGFFHPTSGYVANLNSAYIQLPYNYLGDGAYFVFRFSDLTGISNLDDVASTDTDNAAVYDLNGRRMTGTQLQKGIYVKNGKKFIVK